MRVGGAGRHGARLLPTAVFEAMQRSRGWVGGAPLKRARPMSIMLGTNATCFSKGGPAFLVAHFPAATAVLESSFEATLAGTYFLL